jgi:hypothetical protein
VQSQGQQVDELHRLVNFFETDSLSNGFLVHKSGMTARTPGFLRSRIRD